MQKYTVFLLLFFYSISFGQQVTRFNSILFIDSDHGWIQANDNRIFITRDGGNNWLERNCPDGYLYFQNEMNGWIVTDEYIYSSEDGGEQWTMRDHFTDHYLTGIIAHDNFLFMFGADSNNSAVIYKSSIDSLIWSKSDITTGQIKDVKFSGDIGFASNQRNMYKTDDLDFWYRLPTANLNPESAFSNEAKIQLISQNIIIVQKTFSGVYPIYGFAFSVDQGRSWADFPYLEWAWSNPEFYFIGLKTGWATIDDILVKTDNYGTDWDTLLTTNDSFLGLVFIDSLEAWAVNGTNVFYTNDGWESNEIKTSVITKITNSITNPSLFSLDQNYPNPFNQSTKISFSITAPENVKIEIFNSVGRRMDTLLKSYVQAGQHSISFNAKGLSSGVYFYKMTSGNFFEIKKMLLIK